MLLRLAGIVGGMRFNSRTDCDARVRLVIERPGIMLLEILAALLHFDEHDWFSHKIDESRAATVLSCFANSELGGAACIQ